MRTADFDYALPPALIAQAPAPERDQSRLLVLDRSTGALAHRRFLDLLEYLRRGDILVLNDSRVLPARLRGVKARSGGGIEILLLEEIAANDWWVMLRPGKRVRAGSRLNFPEAPGRPSGFGAEVVEKNEEGHCRLRFTGPEDILQAVEKFGEIPLPPYIHRAAGADGVADRERYQTVFARTAGSVAAPTAGLHFTEPMLEAIRELGVEVCFVTLHVGLGTFAPVKSETIEGHAMHGERFDLGARTAADVNAAKESGRRVIAVGTTAVRVLETVAALNRGRLAETHSRTKIFIHPPHRFRVVDALLTNFHLPQSTLLMLVSAFAVPGATGGREMILEAYAAAVSARYRFFSYGDAMLIL